MLNPNPPYRFPPWLLAAACLLMLNSALAGDAPDATALNQAIDAALASPAPAYRLRVNCTDAAAIRRLELFPDGAGFWNGEAQIGVPDGVRRQLLGDLKHANFAAFRSMYGGRPEPAEGAAGFRVSCMIWLSVGGLEKLSAQQVSGEQSDELLALAARLLDRAEPLAKTGIRAADLQDGLEKVRAGILAPEALRLRFVDLPPADAGWAGTILRVEGGRVARQAYRPGQAMGPIEWRPLGPAGAKELAAALADAHPATLPPNLWAAGQLQLEVEVLQHRKTVSARPFSRLSPEDSSAEQQAFDRLVEKLRGALRTGAAARRLPVIASP